MFSDYLAYDPSYDNGNKWYQIRIENSMFHENFGSYAGGVFSPNIYYSS